MNWRLVSENAAIGVVIVLLSPVVAYFALRFSPVRVLGAYFMPLAFVVVLTYFRSQQRTRVQAIAEGIFAGCVFLVVITLVSAVYTLISPPAA